MHSTCASMNLQCDSSYGKTDCYEYELNVFIMKWYSIFI